MYNSWCFNSFIYCGNILVPGGPLFVDFLGNFCLCIYNHTNVYATLNIYKNYPELATN